MKNYSTENIINLAITGHASTGKTILSEAMVTPSSSLVGQTIENVSFRYRFDCFGIWGKNVL